AFSAYMDGAGNIGADGTELWLGVLLGRVDTGNTSGELRVDLERDGSLNVRLNSQLPDTDTHLLVAHLEFNSGVDDTFTLYVDPDLSLAPTGGVSTNVADLSFDQIALSGGVFGNPKIDIFFDEFRIAESATDLGFAAVPEPSTYALFMISIAAFSLGLLRKKVGVK
ncbi:MAG: PEP-CTERM sorting domain-containing protein, partial [Verrucomicrobiota bacterium]